MFRGIYASIRCRFDTISSISHTLNCTTAPPSASTPADLTPAAATGNDGHLFRLSRSNVLLTGPESMLDAAIAAIVGRPRAAVPSWPSDCTAGAVDAVDATFIVHNARALDAAEQQRLYEWLETKGEGVRVITTTHEPLYPLVEARTFLEPLYYRLNIVCVDCLGLERAGRLA